MRCTSAPWKWPIRRWTSRTCSARHTTLADLGNLHQIQQASIPEVMDFIDRERLFGLGCRLVDLLVLASTLMTAGVELWTLDKRLGLLAQRFGVMHQPTLH